MFEWIRKRGKDKPDEPSPEFNHIMNFARDLAKSNPVALIDLVRVLLRPLQAELLLSAIEKEMHGAQRAITDFKFFMPDGPSDLQMAFDCPRLNSEGFLVQLNRDPVLPCPWHRGRYASALADIGSGKPCGDWKEDSTNHFVTVWLPWGVAFVNGGNHSIAAGIVGGEGVLQPNEVYDMGKMLDRIKCDGKHFRLIADGQILDRVHDVRIAAVFEIGRILRDCGVTPMRRLA